MWDLWLRQQLVPQHSWPHVFQQSLAAVHLHKLAVRSWRSKSHAYVVTSTTLPLSSMSTLPVPKPFLKLVGYPTLLAEYTNQQHTLIYTHFQSYKPSSHGHCSPLFSHIILIWCVNSWWTFVWMNMFYIYSCFVCMN